MEVITTHVNADFDAFGSMVAAKKLYPDAVVAFPGSQEKSLRDFFMESTLYILAIERAKDIDLEKVERLILVDTRQRSRIGRFASLVGNGRTEIHVYDHHPESEDDIKGDIEVIEEVGSTVTILTREMRNREIEPNAEEATVLALGIYEDTGSFSFSSTTPDDLDAAAWLLGKGANVRIISDMMTADLSKDQIEVFHQFIEEAEIVNLGGLEILVTTASCSNYVADVALLVHKYMDMESLDAIFALVRMDDRVHLVARSRLEEVNAGEFAAEFGGGGHPTAASATIRDLSLYEVRDKLVKMLERKVHPKKEAYQIMSRPVITITPDRNLGDATELLSRYQISSLPVVDNGKIMGILHRQSVERACHHGLSDQPVVDFMDPDVVTVSLHDPMDSVIKIAVDVRRRLVPVVDNGALVGVISRSDLLEHMKIPRAKDYGSGDEFSSSRMRAKSVRRLLEEHFPDKVIRILRTAGEVAERREEDVYLVGGAVRDLLLRKYNLDIDLVVEGQGIAFSRELAAQFPGCRVRGHEKFGTAAMLFEDGFKMDVATARHEFYARPGALPTVETSSIKRDLYRRDFTMNTLAVNLNPGAFGRVIDFFGGARDIKEKVIRVLHNLAFVEDPTRILRAIRFSSRFEFAIAKHTLNLMKRAVKMKVFDRVEGKRLRNELIHMLEEKNPLPPVTLAADLGIFTALHPALVFSTRTKDLMENASRVLAWWTYLFSRDKLDGWMVYFLALTDTAGDEEFDRVMTRFSFPTPKTSALVRQRTEMRKALAFFARGEDIPRSEVAHLLQGFSMETLLLMMAKTTRDDTRKAISEYISVLRHVRPILTGSDLAAMGYKPGPMFAEILKALRDARLDNLVQSEQEERGMVARVFPFGLRPSAADRMI